MATRSISLQAASSQDLETMTMSYIAHGFTIANKTSAQVTLIKKKPFPVVWLIIDLICISLFGFGLLMIAITLIIYASDSDQMVTITVGNLAPQAYSGQLAQPGTGQFASQPYSGQIVPQASSPYSGQFAGSRPLTPSGAYGVAAAPSSYLTAPRSPDGYYWWDGQAWQPVPQAGQTGPMGQPPTQPLGY